MSTTDVRTQVREFDQDRVLANLRRLLRGIAPEAGDAVALSGPGLGTWMDATSRKSLLEDEGFRDRRQVLMDHIRALLAINRLAREQKLPLAEAARQYGERCRATLEKAWVEILTKNRDREETVRWVSLAFSNLQTSRKFYRRRLHFVDATAEEIATDAGMDWLTDTLSAYVDRPDPRDSFGYVVVKGWVGTPAALHRLAQRVHDGRAVLVTDAPAFENLDNLEIASQAGNLLEKLAGEDVSLRHAIVLGNRGRVRERFQGRHAEEASDVYCDVSAPWFALFMHNIAQGRAWVPPVGYWNPVVGMDETQVDLLLQRKAGFQLLGSHRVNPMIRLAARGSQVVIWGADTLCKSDGGVQMGVAIVEMLVARYTEWVVNREGILRDLEQGEERLRKQLSEFVRLNSGAGRMFRSGSRVDVRVDYETRGYEVVFDLEFRQVAERAVIRIQKASEGDRTKLEASKA